VQLLFTADIHLVGDFKTKTLEGLRAMWKSAQPDALVVAGDISESTLAEDSLKLLRRITGPDAPIAICLGNHDAWASKRALETARNLEDIEERYWRPAADRYNVTLLDCVNAQFDAFTIVGAYGHYDYGFAVPGLVIDGEEMRSEDYARGTVSSAGLTWNDKRHMPCSRGDCAEADRQAAGLDQHLAAAVERQKPVLVVTHTAPFDALIGRPCDPFDPRSFFRAHSGSTRMGAVIEKYAAHIAFLACGHTHCEVGPFQLDVSDSKSILAANIGSDYGNPRGVLVDTNGMTVWRVPS